MPRLSIYRSLKQNIRKNSSGSVLMIAMWALSILAIFAVAIGASVNSKIDFVNRYTARSILRYTAKSGAEKAIAILAAKGPDSINDLLSEIGGMEPGVFDTRKIGKGEFFIGYNIFTDDGVKWYGVYDEEGKININTANYKTIAKLIDMVTDMGKKRSDDLAAAIVDWRDTDDFPLINGAESKYYTSLKNPYFCKSSRFEVMQELMLVKGMTDEIYKSIEPYIALYGTGKVNMNTAGETVFRALGMDGALIRKIMSFRKGVDGVTGTDDDNMFVVDSSITASLSSIIALSPSEVAVISNLSAGKMLGVSSTAFKIRSLGRMKNKPQICEVICLYDRSKAESDEEAIKYWHERYYVKPWPVVDKKQEVTVYSG